MTSDRSTEDALPQVTEEESASAQPESDDAEPASPEKLKELISTANLQYSLKNYVEAADGYSSATEIQAELNGEMAPENAELLYLYGRCLYKVAVARSDVLGGQVAGEKTKEKKSGASKAKNGAVEASAPAGKATEAAAPTQAAGNQPYFQITGDENWDTDSDEEETGEAEATAVEEEDDFANAYEILDVARILFERQLEGQADAENGEEGDDDDDEQASGKGKAKASDQQSSSNERHVKERLADTHDLQAEISLENERFHDAIEDSRASLALKQQLFPPESSIIAEAHFKLSLALEFASVTALREAQAQDGDKARVKASDVDQKMRDEAAEHMEAATASCRARLAAEEKALAESAPDQVEEKTKSIQEVKEIVEDMEQRLIDLRNPAVSLTGVTNQLDEAGTSQTDPITGAPAQSIGDTLTAEQKARLDEATKSARDLTNLVRHKKKPKAEDTNGKRKLDEHDGDTASEGKRAKTDS